MRGVALSLMIAAAACSRSDTGAAGGAGAGGGAARGIRQGHLEVMHVVAPAPVPGSDSTNTVAAYFQVMNEGTVPDTLYRVEAADGRASMHDQEARGGRQVMVPILSAILPAGEMLRFAPGAQHVMIEGVARPLPAGDSLALTLYFRLAGSIPVMARVVDYADLERELGAAAGTRAGGRAGR